MKKLKHLMAVMLAVIMTLAMTVTAFAAGTVNVTVTNAPDNTTVYAFKLMNVEKNGELYDYTLDDSATAINTALKTVLGLGTTFDAENVYNAIKGKNSSMNAFANDFVTEMGGVTNATATATTTSGTATFAALADGYYLFYVPNVNSAVKTVVGEETVSITMKSDLPDVDKDSDVSDNGTSAGAEIGQVVNFTVKTTVPNITGFVADSYVFKLTDTLSEGLDFVTGDGGTVNVTVQITDKEGQDTATGTLGVSDNRTMTVDLAHIVKNNQAYAGNEMTITYQAKVNSNAVIDNHNSAEIEYSNNPGTNTTGKTEPDVEYVPTYDLKVNKTASDTNTYLAGAVFTLRKGSANGEAIKVEGSEGVYTYKEDQTSGDTYMTTAGSALSGGNYNLHLKGLKAGTYYLVEETAPSGYNKLDPVKIVITGTAGREGFSAGNYTITVGDPGKVEGDQIVDLENRKGSLLPETGGMGTVLFTAIGVVLIAGVAVSFGMSRKKKEN